MQPRRLSHTLALIVSLAGGCQVIGGYKDFGAAVDASVPSPCAALHAPPTSSSKVLGAGDAAMTMLLVDNLAGSCFWIGAEEVSVQQYRAWLSNLNGSTPDWHDPDNARACAWKTSTDGGAPASPFDPGAYSASDCAIPAGEADPFADNKPIRCVDWCEADAFCHQLQGGRLCYAWSTVQASVPAGKANEWAVACSAENKLVYSFDPTSSPSVCNFNQEVAGVRAGSQWERLRSLAGLLGYGMHAWWRLSDQHGGECRRVDRSLRPGRRSRDRV